MQPTAFRRMPLTLVDADGHGLRLAGGAPVPAFIRAVLARRGWSWRDRFALLRLAARWHRLGFRCDPTDTVAMLTRSLPDAVRRDFIDPLCVAALNTPADDGERHGVPARPARRARRRAAVRPTCCCRADRSVSCSRRPRAPGSNGRARPFASAIASNDSSATAPAGRSTARAPIASSSRRARSKPRAWSQPHARGLGRGRGGSSLRADRDRLRAQRRRGPARADDRACAPTRPGRRNSSSIAASSAANPGCSHSSSAAPRRGSSAALPSSKRRRWPRPAKRSHVHLAKPLTIARTIVEKRATFACTPGLARPAATIAPGLLAAGDYIDGPYPATLEGAVRSGVAAGSCSGRADRARMGVKAQP